MAGNKPLVVVLNISCIGADVALPDAWAFLSPRSGRAIRSASSGWWAGDRFPAEQTYPAARLPIAGRHTVWTWATAIFCRSRAISLRTGGEQFTGAIPSGPTATSSRKPRRLCCPERRPRTRWRPTVVGDGRELFTSSIPMPSYEWTGPTTQISGRNRQRVFIDATVPPSFTLNNYRFVLFDEENSEGMAKAFFNTLTVVIPATIIPILIAAFAAYALAWMDFPGRALLIAAVVGLLVVPLQLALIPLLNAAQRHRDREGYLGRLAGAHRVRTAARDLPVAQLHGRPSPRHHRKCQGRRRHGFPDLRARSSCR